MTPRAVPRRRALLGTMVVASWIAASAAWACHLPFDPFTVGLPEGKTQFDGFVDNGAGGWDGYVLCETKPTVTKWIMYWDPSKGAGGTQTMVNGIAPSITGFEITKGGPRVDLFDLELARSALDIGLKKPMKVSEIYDREQGEPWKSNWRSKFKSPWMIPPDESDPSNLIMNDDGTEWAPNITQVSGPGTSNIAGAIPASGSSPAVFATFVNNLQNDAGIASLMTSPGVYTPGTVYRYVPVGWTGNGGTWSFADNPGPGVDGNWELDIFGTGLNSGNETPNGISASLMFETPSEPYFYKVKPHAIFRIQLTQGSGDSFKWDEEQVNVSATGVATPTGVRASFAITANGIIEKKGKPGANGPFTLACAMDRKPPAYAHLKTDSNVRASSGKPIDSGVLTVSVVDNNPYAGTTALPAQWASASPAGGQGPNKPLFDPTKAQIDLYYSAQVYDYTRVKAGDSLGDPWKVPPSDFQRLTEPDSEFPIHTEMFKWFKTTATSTDAVPAGLAPFVNGQAAPGTAATWPYGSPTNPSFSVVNYTIQATKMTQPTGIHNTSQPLSNDQSLSGGRNYTRFADHRTKFFGVPTDSSGNRFVLNGFTSPDPDTMASANNGSAAGKADDNGGYAYGESGQVKNNAADYAGTTFKPAVDALGGTPCDGANLGPLGYVDAVVDNVRPQLVVLVTDMKLGRTYVLNDKEHGWWTRPEAKTGGATPDNTWFGGWSDTTEMLTFGAKDANVGLEESDEINAAVKAQIDNPSSVGLTKAGIWVDEDARLIFKVMAWDNVNYWDRIDDKEPGRVTWAVKDDSSGANATKNDLPADSEGRFEYTFRSANRGKTPSGDPVPKKGEECSLTFGVEDGNGNKRSLQVFFYVAANLTEDPGGSNNNNSSGGVNGSGLITLEEKRRQKTR